MISLLQAIGETILWTLVGLIILYSALRLFDWITPTDYQGEIRRGNVAAAILVGSFIVSLTAIIVAVIVT